VGGDPWAIVVAAFVLLVLTLVMRWVFRPSRPRAAVRPPDAADSPNLGLLTVILSGVDRQEALARRATLGDSRIRSSMSRRRDGSYDVLVFHGDANRARILLGP
jgi:hypothetical protein